MDLYELGISTHQVFNAYKKLKHYFFYDSSTLFVRQKIADFEDDFFKDSNKDEINHIKNKLFNRVNDVFKKIEFDNIPKNELEIISLPKKIKDNKSDLTTNSKRNGEGIEIEDFYFFINPSVEIHILSTLWVMYAGRFLNCDLSESCYANKLDLNVDFKYEEPYENLKLFKPYFIQYQNWRDDALKKAESLLDEKKDVCILSLDIKDYYHSISLNFENIKNDIKINIQKYFKHKNLDDYKDQNLIISLKLTDILLKIHEDYLKKLLIVKNDYKSINKNRYPLPIGLLSSCFLGNYFLKDFDQMVIKNINPAFYGRYVDDLMFVFSDLQINDDKTEISQTLKFLYDNFYRKDVFDIVESDSRSQLFCLDKLTNKFILKNSSSISSLIDKYKEESNCKYNSFIDEEYIIKQIIGSLTFKIKNPNSLNCNNDSSNVKDLEYGNLIIKTSKTVLHFLKHNESRAVLNIFKKKLEKQRSEFRFLPDEDEISEQFDEEAFNLKYNDSENKFRSIEDFSENKYGASKFLAKKIFAVSFGDKKEDDEETDKQILTFFKESTGLKFYSLWEKVATYFVLRNCPENLIKFKRNIELAISKANIKNNYLKNFLDSSLAIALSLNPKLEFKFLDYEEDQEIKELLELVIKFRQSNMFRVSLISIPGINFTNYIYTRNNLVNNDFNRYFENTKVDFKLENLLCFLAPYYVPFHECNILKIISVVSTLSDDEIINTKPYSSAEPKFFNKADDNLTQENTKLLEDKDHKIDKINNIPNDAFILYYQCNYSWKDRKRKINDLKDKYFKIRAIPIECNGPLKSYEVEVLGEKEDAIISDLNIKENKRIALANIKIDNSNVEKSYLGKPNLSKNRRKTIFRLLNEADELNSDMIIFPEVSIPYSWLRLLVERSHKRYMGIVAGLEHWVNSNNIAFNFMVTILPFKIHDNTTSLIKIRLKNHYSPYEKHLLTGYRLLIPKDTIKNYEMSYDLFHWRNSYFSVYNCFELADIYHRSLFKSKVDFIVASELNKDTQYFSDIAGAWVRDVHSYFIQVNSSNYGDSRLIQPAGSFRKDLIQVKGGINSAVLVGDLDIKKIREFQLMEYHLQKDNIEIGKYDFKPTPPDFDRENVKIRIENKSFINGKYKL